MNDLTNFEIFRKLRKYCSVRENTYPFFECKNFNTTIAIPPITAIATMVQVRGTEMRCFKY